jgi:hypothetical protein
MTPAAARVKATAAVQVQAARAAVHKQAKAAEPVQELLQAAVQVRQAVDLLHPAALETCAMSVKIPNVNKKKTGCGPSFLFLQEKTKILFQ